MGDHRLENIYVRTQRDTETGTHMDLHIMEYSIHVCVCVCVYNLEYI